MHEFPVVANERYLLCARPSLELFLPGDRVVNVLEVRTMNKLYGPARERITAGVVAMLVLSDAGLGVVRDPDVERSIRAEQHVHIVGFHTGNLRGAVLLARGIAWSFFAFAQND
jgi:hypothetical protein